MSLPIVIGVGLLGGLGAVFRFALDGVVAGRAGGQFPFGTLLVNVLGAFVLGILAGAAVGGSAYRLEATGFIGGFTTFSTWAFETHRLGEDGQVSLGVLNVVVSLALGIAAAWAGRQIGAAL